MGGKKKGGGGTKWYAQLGSQLLSAAAGAAASAIDSQNQMDVEVHGEGEGFTGGSTVRGEVHVRCTVPFAAAAVQVQLKGFMRAHFEVVTTAVVEEGLGPGTPPGGGPPEGAERPTPPPGPPPRKRTVKQVEERCETVEFFRMSVPVFSPQDGGYVFPAGRHSFPFEFTLPAALPGSFYERGGSWGQGTGFSGEVTYKVKGAVCSPWRGEVKNTRRIVVTEPPPAPGTPPARADAKHRYGGKRSMAAACSLDRPRYDPGDTVIARLEARSNNTSGCRRITVTVERALHLRCGRDSRRETEVVHKYDFPGTDPCFYGVRHLHFHVPVDVLPSTTGGRNAVVTHEYFMHVRMVGGPEFKVPLDLAPSPMMFAGRARAQPPMRALPQDLTYRPPWMPDKSSSKCSGCDAKFGIFKRRHHCRACGRIFCHECTPSKRVLQALGYEGAERVCGGCDKAGAAGGAGSPTAAAQALPPEAVAAQAQAPGWP